MQFSYRNIPYRKDKDTEFLELYHSLEYDIITIKTLHSSQPSYNINLKLSLY